VNSILKPFTDHQLDEPECPPRRVARARADEQARLGAGEGVKDERPAEVDRVGRLDDVACRVEDERTGRVDGDDAELDGPVVAIGDAVAAFEVREVGADLVGARLLDPER
jgi:hypothetical protein